MAKTYTFTRVAGFNKALRSLSKEASVELRGVSVELATGIATKAATRARSVGGSRVATLVAPTIRARKDRVPKIVAGGAGKAGLVLWGAEYGGGARPTTRQFNPWVPSPSGRGSVGYFMWPTVREESGPALEEYGEALMRAVDKSARKAGG